MTILDELVSYARLRVAKAKEVESLESLKARALKLPRGTFPFTKALQTKELSFICEVKKASPSKGLIAPNFPYVAIAQAYEAAGASCLSVLTEPKWFLGSNAYLQEIAAATSVPCLRKDFTVDAYMLYEAKVLGAAAVLLIVSVLTDAELKAYLEIADELGLSSVVEAHDAGEVDRALHAGAQIIGVNNRNLQDFSVDMENSQKLRELIPQDKLFISESGITNKLDVQRARALGADAVLVGEALMRSKDIAGTLKDWRQL